MIRVKAGYFLFDIGGVLLSLDYHRMAARVQALTGLDPRQVQGLLAREGLVQKFETGQIEGKQFHAEVCRRFAMEIPWDAFLEMWNSILGAPLVSEELIAEIAAKIRLWVISNTNELHFAHLKKICPALRHFEGYILSHEVGVLKPEAGIFRHALEKFRVPAGDVLFVDDQEANVSAARHLGVDAFRFAGPKELVEELKRRGIL